MFSRAALVFLASSATLGAQAVPPPATPPLPQVYLAFQVEKSVSASPRNKPPEYPMELRRANIEGDVLAKFVVDSTGHVILSTFSVLKSQHDLFTRSVRDALPTLLFTPAELGGRKVAQLVQMPFVFSLAPHDTGTTTVSRP